MTLNEAIAAFNLPDGVLQIAITLSIAWALVIVVVGTIAAIIGAILDL